MISNISLGRYRGISIGASWTTFLIIGLICFNVAGGILPATNPGLPGLTYVAAGLIGAVLLLGSILVHELSHAIIAQRNGIRVTGITLWALGGVAQLEGEPKSPGADFRIAAVGPLISLVLGVLFGGMALVAAATTGAGLVVSTLMYLAVANVSLAVFNIIPATPLDGGRILRSAVWQGTGNRVKAVVVAGRSGQGLGGALIAYGVVQVFASGSLLAGIWYMILGFFLWGAATAEVRYTTGRQALEGRTVGDITPTGTAAVPRAGLSVAEVYRDVVPLTHLDTYPVLDADGSVIGVVRRRVLDLVPAADRPEVRVWTFMETVPQVDDTMPLQDVVNRFGPAGVVVVTRNGVLRGVVTLADVQRAAVTW